MVLLGGARLITDVADERGVGVHFNPFVSWNDKVHLLLDNLDITNVNLVNLRAAMSAALLLLQSKFTEEELYAKICSLSYMGDLRKLLAEDRNKDGGLLAARSLVSSLPPMVRSQMGMKLGEKKVLCDSGRVIQEIVIGSKDEAAKCMQTILRRKVMVSSERQAVSGLLAAGGINATRYLGAKMSKAWKSWR